MTRVRYACCDELRRVAVAGHATLNAIDYLEVGDLVAPGELDQADLARYNAMPVGDRDQLLWQRRLTLRLVNPLTAEHVVGLADENLRIEGGERTRDIRLEVLVPPVTGSDEVVLRASPAGDFSRYAIAFVRSETDLRPPAGFDPVGSTVEFSFKIDCPSEFDCRPGHVCIREPRQTLEIDYLAKDYASFRRLILDRMALLTPTWRDRSPADLGIAVVELLAYVGDHLSYQQDAVATEAYLETARRRASVRRHAALVDYAMHEGSNARAWVQVEVSADLQLDPSALQLCTTVDRLSPRIAPGSDDEQVALAADVEWFEPVQASLDPEEVPEALQLVADHQELRFYTWGDDQCCLPRGATSATLVGHHDQLAPGVALVFEEVKGPLTGDVADADAGHRHVVRLTGVEHTVHDPPQPDVPLTDPLDGTAITTIDWHPEDELPFPLCLSSRTEAGDVQVADVSVARGNLLLVDHGRTLVEDLGAAPPPILFVADADQERCERPPRVAVPARYRPRLGAAPLTHAGTVRVESVMAGVRTIERLRFDPGASATSAFDYQTSDCRPAIALESVVDGATTDWMALRDLLNSARDAPEFVVETEHGGTAELRFGDGENGARPRTDERFMARYRVGNGRSGNVGADSIVHAVTADSGIVAVRNPLPARGGTDPETIEQVRRRAPQAFRTQERAVTPADYESVTAQDASVQRAAATFRWTGSWHTVFLTVDQKDGSRLDATTEAALARHVDRYRMAGHDLEFDDPRFVPLELELFVCVADAYFRADVKRRLLDVLSARALPDGRRGLFHPDGFTFGQTIYLSPILAAARGVTGVASAEVVTFQRQGIAETRYLEEGRLALGRLEIARLDNDPNFPEHGVLRLEMGGGK